MFHILRNARLLKVPADANLVVCWGGHAISRNEYDYTKLVGYELGLRGLNICTGCGPGAMKGPMKGATIGHSKQRIRDGRYIGITEPGIIAAESPNPIVNSLVIMPDMEKRLEAFVRVGHGVIIFPGGVGTTEEILYLLGVMLQWFSAMQVFLKLIFYVVMSCIAFWLAIIMANWLISNEILHLLISFIGGCVAYIGLLVVVKDQGFVYVKDRAIQQRTTKDVASV